MSSFSRLLDHHFTGKQTIYKASVNFRRIKYSLAEGKLIKGYSPERPTATE